MKEELRKAAEARAQRANRGFDEEMGEPEDSIADNETQQESNWTEITEDNSAREDTHDSLVESE